MCGCLSRAGSAPDQLQGGPKLRLLSLYVTSNSCRVWACFLFAPVSLDGIAHISLGPAHPQWHPAHCARFAPCLTTAPGPRVTPAGYSFEVLPSICAVPPQLFPRLSIVCALSLCTKSGSTGTCMPLHLSGSFILSWGCQVGWALVTQNPSSPGLLLTWIIKNPVLLSYPGLFSNLSCLPQLSTLLNCGH